MCGIVGALSLDKPFVNPALLRPMADKIAHRGRDDAGYLYFHTGTKSAPGVSFYQNLTDRNFKAISPLLMCEEDESAQAELNFHDYDLMMAHRRLSIIDLSPAAHQPMSDISREVWIVFNGEIYNYQDLRARLAALGYKFKTSSDTEVILYAYIHYGTACVKEFNGMFAFALWDNRKKKFFIARDRYGIKPLYYYFKDGFFIFASENKAILEYKDLSFSLDKAAFYEYFTFQNIFTDRTFFAEIRLLEPGSFIELDLNKRSFKKSLYWDFNFFQDGSLDEVSATKKLKELFAQAVSRQLASDVEIGSFLSGGIDSGSITAVAASKLPLLKTFTVGFDLSSASGIELSFDERARAERLSYIFQTEHYEMVLKSGDMQRCLPLFAYHLEEPRIGQSYPNFYASKLASRFVKVALSGIGGDELFGGYPWRYYRAAASTNFDDYINKYYVFWQRLLPNRDLKELFEPIRSDVAHVQTIEIFRNVFKKNVKNNSPQDYINHSLYFEAKTFLRGLLTVEDKLSMAHGLETRVPFLDNDLVDFACSLPVNFKLANLQEVVKIDENSLSKASTYFQKTNDGKKILRQAVKDYIPQDIAAGVKQGFSSPDSTWFRGQSVDFVRLVIGNKNAAMYEFLDPKKVREIAQRHFDGKENRRLFIWSLINFEKWLQTYAAQGIL